MNIASAVEEPALQADFFDEKGLLKEYQPKSMHVLSVSGPTPGHSVPPAEEDPLMSTEGVFSHSVPLTEENSVMSTEGVFSHSVPLMKKNSLTSTEDRSQMNCASISNTAKYPESSSDRVVGSNNPSLSITDLPLTQEKVESTYADVFQGLGKFPGEPYKLRLKPDAVPAKHRPRKVPVHLQDAFHEEVE